jgi:hypothetical protein
MYVGELWSIFVLRKIAPKSLWRYFEEKNAPNAKKYRPNGESSPNLVTLPGSKPTIVE